MDNQSQIKGGIKAVLIVIVFMAVLETIGKVIEYYIGAEIDPKDIFNIIITIGIVALLLIYNIRMEDNDDG